jgi:putative serine protease XkdF
MSNDIGIDLGGEITKLDEDQRLVSGWFSVIEENGASVVDLQGDVIDEADLVKAAHQFNLDARRGQAMHKGSKVADVVESIVFTRELQKALGIDLGKVGWFATMKVHDDATWAAVKSGKLGAFSIGGRGVRDPIAA